MAITKIQIDNSALNKESDFSPLKAEVLSTATTIEVVSINQFAVNKILLIGEFGAEKSEIIKTHASTAPTGNTVTLASAVTYDHAAGTNIYIIDYDQYELSHADTATGTKTLLTTTIGTGLINVDPEVVETLYSDTEYSDGFYFVRKKETVAGTFSSYSDALPLAGYDPNTVGYMIERALRENSVTLSELLTQADCLEYINDCLRLIQGKQVRWPEHLTYNYITGQTSGGVNVVSLPSNIYDNNSNRSILGLRIGDSENLQYITPTQFETEMQGTINTTTRSEASATDTTLALANSYDFEDTGSVTVYVNNTKHTLSYTGVTRDDSTGGTAVLSGIPASGEGSITVTIPGGTNVWQGEAEAYPRMYTIRDGAINIAPLPSSTEFNKNVFMDYSVVATAVDSDTDTIDYQRFDMVKDYLTWRIKMKLENDGELNMSDGFYSQFKEKLNDAVRTSVTLGKKMRPRINRMMRRGGFSRKADPKLLPNDQQ